MQTLDCLKHTKLARRPVAPPNLDDVTTWQIPEASLHAAVTLNEKKMSIQEDQTELEVIPYVERGEFLILWQKHRPGLGNAVELTTGELAHCWDSLRP